MKVKLHNKFEISQGNETYVAYNTLTYHIIENIAGLSPFATYFAFGNGTGTVNYNTSKLNSWVKSFATTLEEVQNDISHGDLYVKRTLTLGENEEVGLSFCEIGMTNSNQSNPDISNHVFVKDENNNIVNVVKKRGQSLFIRMTVYLDIAQASKPLLCSGNNLLIKALLGEYAGITWTAMRGANLQPNSLSIYRNVPRTGQGYACQKAAQIAGNLQSATITLEYDLDTGETPEIVVCLDGFPVARYNTLTDCTAEQTTKTVTSLKNYNLLVDEYVDEINGVQDTSQNAVTGYFQTKYATEFLDYIASPFDATFTADNARWVSEDGDKIAFVSGGKLYLYVNSNYNLKKISNSVSVTNLTKVIMFDDYVFLLYSASPYLQMYKINNGVLENVLIDMSVYQNFSASYDFQDMMVISNSAHTLFTFGFVLGQIDKKAVIAYATIANNTLTFSSFAFAGVDYVVHLFALYRTNFCDSMIGFVTNNYGTQQNGYRVGQYYADGTSEVTNEIMAYYLVNNTTSLKGKSRAVVLKKNSSPYFWVYYYPQVYRYTVSVATSLDSWISTNLLYFIQKSIDENQVVSYKVYSLTDYDNPVEFTDGLPQEINQANITDFEFLKDTLLIFTTTQTYALNLKETKLLLQNMPNKETDYVVDYDKIELKGASASEGVNGSFQIGVSI